MIACMLPLLLFVCVTCALEERVFGFNYGSHWANGTAKKEASFKRHFENAKLVLNGQVSARLYTTVQHDTTDDIIEAIKPAIESKTSLLLGMWPHENSIDNELTALNKALDYYGSELIELIVGISVGNEDIYRLTDGCYPDCADESTIKTWIDTVRSNLTTGKFAATMGTKKIGHVDTVLAWTSGTTDIKALITVCDFIGITIHPYWSGISIDRSAESFSTALKEAQSIAGSKPLFIAETGWPWAGIDNGAAQVGPTNMQVYWEGVACSILGQYNSWWYQLEDDAHDGRLWGIFDDTTGHARFDVACKNNNQMLSTMSLSSVSITLSKADAVNTQTGSDLSPSNILSNALLLTTAAPTQSQC
jgi:glucan endo-1,3-beta-D-glucosidase